MRGSFVFWLALVLPLLLWGCGMEDGQAGRVTQSRYFGAASAQEQLEEAEGASAWEYVKIGVAQAGHESDWRVLATKICRESFRREDGYQLSFVDADNDPKAQVEAVRQMIREQVDYILIDPVVPTGWTAVLKEAYHAKIPVFVMDRTIDCDPKYYRAWVGSDFVLEGRLAGQWLQNYQELKKWDDRLLRIVTIRGTDGSVAQVGRTQGFAEYVRKNANWRMLAEKSGDFTEQAGQDAMQELLEEHPDFNVVVCQNDNEAIGACRALEKAGKSYGRDGDIVVISFDATRAGLEAVLDGKLNCDVECNPRAARYVKRGIEMLEQGESLPYRIHFLPEDCFIGERYLPELVIDGVGHKPICVTEELLQGRE